MREGADNRQCPCFASPHSCDAVILSLQLKLIAHSTSHKKHLIRFESWKFCRSAPVYESFLWIICIKPRWGLFTSALFSFSHLIC